MPQGHGSCIIKFLCSDDKSNCGLLPPFRPQGLLMWCEEYEYNYWLQTEPFRFFCSAVAVRPSVRLPALQTTIQHSEKCEIHCPKRATPTPWGVGVSSESFPSRIDFCFYSCDLLSRSFCWSGPQTTLFIASTPPPAIFITRNESLFGSSDKQ